MCEEGELSTMPGEGPAQAMGGRRCQASHGSLEEEWWEHIEMERSVWDRLRWGDFGMSLGSMRLEQSVLESKICVCVCV